MDLIRRDVRGLNAESSILFFDASSSNLIIRMYISESGISEDNATQWIEQSMSVNVLLSDRKLLQ